MNQQDVRTFLKDHDIKPSYQRMRIFQYMIDNKNHPTVDMIFQALIDEIPTLSRTTVYNTLNLFIEKGVAMQITIEDNTTRYDADVSRHGHFKCENCGNVSDFQVEHNDFHFDGLEGYDINRQHYYFSGLCVKCR